MFWCVLTRCSRDPQSWWKPAYRCSHRDILPPCLKTTQNMQHAMFNRTWYFKEQCFYHMLWNLPSTQGVTSNFDGGTWSSGQVFSAKHFCRYCRISSFFCIISAITRRPNFWTRKIYIWSYIIVTYIHDVHTCISDIFVRFVLLKYSPFSCLSFVSGLTKECDSLLMQAPFGDLQPVHSPQSPTWHFGAGTKNTNCITFKSPQNNTL